MDASSQACDTSIEAVPQFRVSVPGRTEVAGNHQDHQGGCVIAAAIDRRITCLVYLADNNCIEVRSGNNAPVVVDLSDSDWWVPRVEEQNTTVSLVRGMASQLKERGVMPQSCMIEVCSDVPSGAGLSSSAAFELAIGSSLAAIAGCGVHELEGEDCEEQISFSPLDLSQMALRAENDFFAKPCGIMDQIACSYGGIVLIDFKDRINPTVERIEMPQSFNDYTYVLVNCGSSHEDMTDAFASVAQDMQTAANMFNVTELRDLSLNDYLEGIKQVRTLQGDLVALRGLAFFEEYDLVRRRMDALLADDTTEFVHLSNKSSVVSAEYLQNVGYPGPQEGASVALALCHTIIDDLLKGSAEEDNGSARIHGGGFGGTIQVIVPNAIAQEFKARIEKLLGEDSCMAMHLGEPGIEVEPC